MAEGILEDDSEELWERVDSGGREPVSILYVTRSPDDLEEIVEWGNLTGRWDIRCVPSVRAAIQEHRREPCELVIALDVGIRGTAAIARAFPQLPISVAKHGGWDKFPEGFPPQVVLAQWAAPRPTEFAEGVADALSSVSTQLIVHATRPPIEVVRSVSAELLARLAEYPQERFQLDPYVFEETVAELLSKMGYDVRLTPRSGDEGRDVIAAYHTPAAPVLMLVECKRYRAHRKVGPEPITRVWSRLFDDKASMAMVVTTSDFG